MRSHFSDILLILLALTCTSQAAMIKTIDGPTDSSKGMLITDGQMQIPFDHGSTGTFSLWIKTDKTYGGTADFPNAKIPIASADGLFDLRLQTAQGRAMIVWDWGKDVKGCDNLNIQLPSLPGPAWYHLYYIWDAQKGLFTGYLNGTPLRLEGTVLPTWTMGTSKQVILHASPLAYATPYNAVECEPYEITRNQLPEKYRDNMAEKLGAKFKPTVDLTARIGKQLFDFPLTNASQTKDWIMEGPGKATFDHDGMTLISTVKDESELQGHIVYWMPHDLPENFIAQWTMQPLSEAGLCITFFAAKGVKGEDIFDPSLKKRDGVFKQYTQSDINCYHFSYYANTPFNLGRITTNLRKNSGFNLIANGAPGITPGSREPHQIMMMKNAGHIVVNVDGKTILDYTDDGKTYGPLLGGGKFGLRQMQWMQARYGGLMFYRLTN